ncbi:hypothetical protein P3L10_032634 [Capsicum annuum]
MPSANQQYRKSELLHSLRETDKTHQALFSSLDSSDINHVEGPMDALSKQCRYARMSHNFSILIFLDYLNNPLLYSFQCFSSHLTFLLESCH